MAKDTSRTRNYATVIYKESAPKNWQEILRQQFIPSFISPYHDSDLNPDGTLKKPHWHVLLMFDSVKTTEQAKQVFSLIGGVGCEKVNSLRGYSRYLCHLDNPEKAQYNTYDVICLCGADYFSAISLSSDKYGVISEMIDFCEKYNITSFYLLSLYAFKNNDSWKRALTDNCAIFMKEYLKSKTWTVDHNSQHIIDPSTGEVIF